MSLSSYDNNFAKTAFHSKWEMRKRHTQMCTLEEFLVYTQKYYVSVDYLLSPDLSTQNFGWTVWWYLWPNAGNFPSWVKLHLYNHNMWKMWFFYIFYLFLRKTFIFFKCAITLAQRSRLKPLHRQCYTSLQTTLSIALRRIFVTHYFLFPCFPILSFFDLVGDSVE